MPNLSSVKMSLLLKNCSVNLRIVRRHSIYHNQNILIIFCCGNISKHALLPGALVIKMLVKMWFITISCWSSLIMFLKVRTSLIFTRNAIRFWNYLNLSLIYKINLFVIILNRIERKTALFIVKMFDFYWEVSL